MATIQFATRIAHATDDQESARFALRGTLITAEGLAVATDGRIAACAQTKVTGLKDPAMIPKELGPTSNSDLKATYHANGGRPCEKHSLVKGQPRVVEAPAEVGRFPLIGRILSGLTPAKCTVLAIDARNLWRLAQAINVPDTGDVVVLLIPPPDPDGGVAKAVGVLSNHESLHAENAAGFGVVMPCDPAAAESRADFAKLCGAATASIDAAAKAWSETGVTESTAECEKTPKVSSSTKPRRRARRKARVA